MNSDPEIEYSPLCGRILGKGLSVEVKIFRIKDSGDDWTLEVVDREGGSTVWDDPFESDQDAFDQVTLTIEKEGIGSFLRAPGSKLS